MPWEVLARARDRGTVVWETRVLVDAAGGAVYREEGLAGSRALSTGLCGRRVVASLASRQLSRDPARIALMQYALEPAARTDLLRRTVEAASKKMVLPDEVTAGPLFGVACPRICWLAPAAVAIDRAEAFLTDDSGVGNAHAEPHLNNYHVERLDRLMVRMIASELAGRLIRPEPNDIVRTVGKPQ